MHAIIIIKTNAWVGVQMVNDQNPVTPYVNKPKYPAKNLHMYALQIRPTS